MKHSSEILRELLKSATHEYHEAAAALHRSREAEYDFRAEALKEASRLLEIVEAIHFDISSVEVK
jgi:hypothetical protein